MIESRRRIIPVIIFALLYGLWAFAIHVHHDAAIDNDSVCQICLHADHNKTTLPTAGFDPIAFVAGTVSTGFDDSRFIATHVRLQDSRAPPLSLVFC